MTTVPVFTACRWWAGPRCDIHHMRQTLPDEAYPVTIIDVAQLVREVSLTCEGR
jgi:hypothetical protein